MIPLTLCKAGESMEIAKVGGKDDIKNHLYDLGFVTGAKVSVVNELAGNIIVNIKDSRVAIDKQMAQKIMVN